MFYIFVFLVILGYVLNSISKKYILNEVKYKRKLSSTELEIGEEFHIYTILENKKLLPVTFLQVKERFPVSMQYKFKVDETSNMDYLYHTTTMMILPYQRIKRDYVVKFNDRGRYLMRNVTLTAGDFLGLNTVSREVEYSDEIIVYPKALDLENEVTQVGEFIGDISVKRWIIDDPLVTSGIREYTGFEPEKTIHWPSSLKHGSLMVRNFDYTSDNSVFIILNIECFKPHWSGINKEAIEKTYSLVRALMDELEQEHIKYGFTTNSQISEHFNGENYLRSSLGEEHYYDILTSLGSADYSISVPFEKLISNTISWHVSCKTYIIITPVVLENYIEPINEMSYMVDKTILFSVASKNMEELKENIIKFTVEEGDKA